MVELNELNILFRQPACEEAIGRKSSWRSGFLPVEFKGGFGFAVDRSHLRNGTLHPKAHFVLGNFRFKTRISGFF